MNLASAHNLLLQNSLDKSVSNPFDFEHLDTKRYGNTGFESELATILRRKKGDQEGTPKRKLKNLLLRTRKLMGLRKLERLPDENEIELEGKENIKKWSSKSNPSKLAWLLRLKKSK